MQIEKASLLAHLNRLHAGGQIDEAVLTGAFASAGHNPSKELIVIVPDLPGGEALPEPVGIVSVSRLIRCIKSLAGDEAVKLEFADNRILASQKHGGQMSIVLAHPRAIHNTLETATLETAKEFIEKQGRPLHVSQTFVQGIKETVSTLSATTVTLQVGKQKGTVRVGEEIRDFAVFDLPGAKVKAKEEPYDLILSASLFVTALGIITDFAQAELVLTGADSMIIVREAGYMYILSPKAEEAV